MHRRHSRPHHEACGGTRDLAIGDVRGVVVADWEAFDLVYFRVPRCEPTVLAEPQLGPARLASTLWEKDCSISDVGDLLLAVVVGHADLPGPGESGTPLFQDGKVVGILSSVNLNSGKGTAISAKVIEKGAEGLI